MRGTTVISLLISGILAVLAVVAARYWLDLERQQILAANQPAPNNVNRIVVATEPLRFGTRLSSSNLRLIDWPSGSQPAGSFNNIEAIVGDNEDNVRFVMAAIEIDEPILATKITIPGQRAKLSATLSQGMKAVSIRVNDVLGVAGFVLPGDRVDIMLTRKDRNRSNSRTFVDVLLQGVKVLAIDQDADDRKDKPSVVRSVTVEVSTKEAQILTLATNVGILSLALRNIAEPGIISTHRVTTADLGNGEVSQGLKNEVKNDKLIELENRVKQVGNRIDGVVDELQKPKPQQEPALIKKKPDIVPPSSYTTVGVTRSGKRKIYRFEGDEEQPEFE